MADNQTDSLAIVAVFIAEQSFFGGDNHLSKPEAVSELMTQAVALSGEELNTALEMNVTLDQLISNIGYVRFKYVWKPLKAAHFHSCFSDLQGFYHYEGSLTTPDCQEIVQWIVMDRPLYVRRWGLVSMNMREN